MIDASVHLRYREQEHARGAVGQAEAEFQAAIKLELSLENGAITRSARVMATTRFPVP